MGPEQSSVGGSPKQTSSELYLPLGGIRTHGEKEKNPEQQQLLIGKAGTRSHIVNTAFAGIWSVLASKSDECPPGRSGNFMVFCEELNLIIIGLGVDQEDNYLSDVWALNPDTLKWESLILIGDQISPRTGSRAVLSGTSLFLFGGYREPEYFGDIYVIDLMTKVCQSLTTTGAAPSPRATPAIGIWEPSLFIWGGFNDSTPPELHELNLDSLEWTAYEQDITGRSAPAYAQSGSILFAYGSSKLGGLVEINLATHLVQMRPATGAVPPPTLVNSSMVHFDSYLMLMGGRGTSEWSLVYCCDISRNWWFVFHILPDGITVSSADGMISELGLFMVPRIHSFGAVYLSKIKKVIAFGGQPIKEPAPILTIDIAEALGSLHLRSDLVETRLLTSGEQNQVRNS